MALLDHSRTEVTGTVVDAAPVVPPDVAAPTDVDTGEPSPSGRRRGRGLLYAGAGGAGVLLLGTALLVTNARGAKPATDQPEAGKGDDRGTAQTAPAAQLPGPQPSVETKPSTAPAVPAGSDRCAQLGNAAAALARLSGAPVNGSCITGQEKGVTEWDVTIGGNLVVLRAVDFKTAQPAQVVDGTAFGDVPMSAYGTEAGVTGFTAGGRAAGCKVGPQGGDGQVALGPDGIVSVAAADPIAGTAGACQGFEQATKVVAGAVS